MRIIINSVIIIMAALIAIAFYTLSERKFLGYIQNRTGPNKPTIAALTIPIADSIKLFIKEEKNAMIRNIKYYVITAIIIIILAIILWPVFPHYSSLFFLQN